jgi:AraC family transcriptional regulator of adaptative response / DNA-3-methyladenine glycosylase II
MPQSRARTIVELARAVASGRVDLARGGAADATVAALLAVPGIGPWTAQYVALRGLSWPDAFPAGDLGIRRALGVTTARAAEQRAGAWRPWRAYAAMHLWSSLA